MSGDATNVDLWQNADVYIDLTRTAPAPTDVATAWGAGWEAVGLLDGSEGFTEKRDSDSSDFYAWGGLLVKQTVSKQKRTIKFVAMEDNATVFGLVNPGSTRTTDAATGVTTGRVKVPQKIEFGIGFETRDGDKVKRRIAARATIEEVGDLKEAETDPTVYEITVALYPSSDGTLYTTLEGTVAA